MFHCGLIVLLGLSIQPLPKPSLNFSELGGGLVLKTSATRPELFDGEDGETAYGSTVDIVDSTEEPMSDLLSMLPDEPVAPPVAAETAVETSTMNAPTVANQAVGNSDAGQFRQVAGQRGAGGDGYATVSVFGVQGKGNKFVYLFDRSSSMDGAPLAAAKRQLIQSLQSMDTVHQFHVIFFNTKTQPLDITGGGRRIAFATDRNKKLAEKFVNGIMADGGTDRITALKQAISFAPDVIFFLTDADDPMSPGELAEVARDNERMQAAISVIEFGRRQQPMPNNFLSELAKQTGGQYGYVNTMTLSNK